MRITKSTLALTAILPTSLLSARAWTTSPPLTAFSTTHGQTVTSNRHHSITALAQSSPKEGEPEEPVSTMLSRNEDTWKSLGEKIILQAAVGCGVKEDEIDIEWKAGKIIITLLCESFLQAQADEDDEGDLEYDEEIDESALDEFDDDFAGNDSDEVEEGKGASVVELARAINFALGEEGEGSVAYNIAVHHQIEVTTRGAPDELYGIMFESYRGFAVFVETIDPKSDGKGIVVVEGTLVERNEKHTVVNVKGRLRKIKNELVLSVKLPKAKKEKGAK